MRGIRERLDRGVVLGAEGYLFELERRGYLKAGAFVPEVVLDFPDAVRELHREMLRAGAEVMVAFTYYGHREKLRSIGREDDLEPLNRQALRLARDVAAEGDALVAGNICNTWAYDPDAPESSGETVREMYREQVRWAAEEGAELIISETHDYLGEALISLEAIQESGLPSIVTFASTDDVTIDGYEFDEACRQLEAKGADVVGLNCSRGPRTMLPLLERIRAAVDGHVAAQPVPYRTTPAQPNFEALKDARRDTRVSDRAGTVPVQSLRDGRLRRRRRATWASTTSASAAAALPITSARWPSAWAGPSRRAATPRTWRNIRSSGRTSGSRRSGS